MAVSFSSMVGDSLPETEKAFLDLSQETLFFAENFQ